MHKSTKIACINGHGILSIAVKTSWTLNIHQLLTTKSGKSISVQRDRWILIDAMMWVNHLNIVFVERIQVYKSILCMAHLSMSRKSSHGSRRQIKSAPSLVGSEVSGKQVWTV